MSLIAKQLVINNINLPKELIDIVKDYAFHKIKKILENDERYQLLQTIPFKEYDPTDDTIYVYLNISEVKDYYLVYINYKIHLQTFIYGDNNHIYLMESNMFSIE